MHIKDVESLRDKINEEIVSNKKLIVLLKDSSKPISPDNAIGRLSRMEAMLDQNMCKSNLRTSEMRLVRLLEALERSEHDRFGLCVQCDEEIPIGRLMLIPECIVCVQCAGNHS